MSRRCIITSSTSRWPRSSAPRRRSRSAFSTAPSEWCSVMAPAISCWAASTSSPGSTSTPKSPSTRRARARAAPATGARAPTTRPITAATRAETASARVTARVRGSTSAKTRTAAVITSAAKSHALRAEEAGEEAGGERDGEDVRERGAEQERADQPLLVLGQAQRRGGALLAAVGHGVQPGPAGGGERGLGAGEERRDQEERHDARQREDRGRLGQGVHAGPHSVADGARVARQR